MCGDFCNYIDNVQFENCEILCNSKIKQDNFKNNSFDEILKRHGYFLSKNEIINEKQSDLDNMSYNSKNENEVNIEKKKDKIKRTAGFS